MNADEQLLQTPKEMLNRLEQKLNQSGLHSGIVLGRSGQARLRHGQTIPHFALCGFSFHAKNSFALGQPRPLFTSFGLCAHLILQRWEKPYKIALRPEISLSCELLL